MWAGACAPGDVRARVYTGEQVIDVRVGVRGEFRLLYNSSCILFFIAFDQQNFPTEIIKFIL